MSIKRLAAAAAVATGLGMSVTAVNGVLANSAPLDPAPCPSWDKACSGNPSPHPGYGGTPTPPVATAPHGTAPPQSTWQSTPPPHSTPPPQSTYQQSPPHSTPPPPSTPPQSTWQQTPQHSTTAPMPTECPNWDKNCTPAPAPNQNPGYGGSGTPPNNTPPSPWQAPANSTPPSPWQQAPQNGSTSSMPTVCPAWYKNCTPAPNPNPNPNPGYGGSTPPNGQPWGGVTPTTGAPWGGQPGEHNSYPARPPRPVLNAPWTQPPHPPYYPPRPPILRPTGEIGGPTNVPGGFCIPGQGAPPPPPPSGYGWSNGPAPGYPPPNWEGPPPSDGWNGSPPAGGWNQPWQGTPVDASYGQNYYAPFTYNNFTVLPVFNSDYGGFGYWFFGTWIPLY